MRLTSHRRGKRVIFFFPRRQNNNDLREAVDQGPKWAGNLVTAPSVSLTQGGEVVNCKPPTMFNSSDDDDDDDDDEDDVG